MVGHLEKMASRIFEVNRITFTYDELASEVYGKNKALHLTMKSEEHYVKRVMVDRGLALIESILTMFMYMHLIAQDRTLLLRFT
ncbi:hypothetical protein RDI58_017746 [Solanum bulbocastanum]|uniref:Uncharacterized protein n=1 Tax=Solanum bulbocastanum TaxID=147425 RepID=A0AAN8TFL6_SOLBU